jgi:hypothetical protein
VIQNDAASIRPSVATGVLPLEKEQKRCYSEKSRTTTKAIVLVIDLTDSFGGTIGAVRFDSNMERIVLYF